MHFMPAAQQHLVEGGQAVGGQFNQQRFMALQTVFEQQRSAEGDQKTDEIQRQQDQRRLGGRKQRSRQEYKDLQSGRTQREGNDQHSEQTQAPRAHHSRSHERWHIAAKAHQQHHKTASVQTQLRHQRVHQKGDAR